MSFKSRLTPQDHALIKEMDLRGEKLEVIAQSVSSPVSRQRIKQLTKVFNIDSFDIRRKQNEKELNEKTLWFEGFNSAYANL